MKGIYFKALICGVLCFVFHSPAKASHSYGADISWKYVGHDSILIHVTNYIDCQGAWGQSPIAIYLRNKSTNLLIKSVIVSVPAAVDITNVCPRQKCTICNGSSCSFPFGILKYDFYTLVHLEVAENCCEILISSSLEYRDCATNFRDIGSPVYIEAMFNRCLNPVDNSPEFANIPPIIVCAGQDYFFSHGVYDTDTDSCGSLIDSLSFHWDKPRYEAAKFGAYLGTYSYDKPLFFWGYPNTGLAYPQGYHLDPTTGNIKFRPSKIESSYYVLKVCEWRKIDGKYVLVGEIRRDIYITSISCNSNSMPSANIADRYDVCAGDSFGITFLTNDNDQLDSTFINLNNFYPGVMWSDNNGQAKRSHGKFSWKTLTCQASNLPYLFSVTVKDNKCPFQGQYTKTFKVFVNPVPSANIIKTKLSCDEYEFQVSDLKYTNTLRWYFNNQLISTTTSFKEKGLKTGNYPLSLVLNNEKCQSVQQDLFTIPTHIALFLNQDTIVCVGKDIFIYPSVRNNMGGINYSWSTGDTTAVLVIPHLTKDSTISLQVNDSIYCDYDTINVRVDDFKIKVIQDYKACEGQASRLIAIATFDIGKSLISSVWSDTHLSKIKKIYKGW